jgi:hypothetical protein
MGRFQKPAHNRWEVRPDYWRSFDGDLGGQGYSNALYVIGMLGYGFLGSDVRATRNGTDMLQASIYSGLVTDVLKYSIIYLAL